MYTAKYSLHLCLYLLFLPLPSGWLCRSPEKIARVKIVLERLSSPFWHKTISGDNFHEMCSSSIVKQLFQTMQIKFKLWQIYIHKVFTSRRFFHCPSPFEVKSGDLNCPDVSWDTGTANSGAPDQPDQQALFDTAKDAELTQVHTGSTREEKLVDLVFTTNPTVGYKLHVRASNIWPSHCSNWFWCECPTPKEATQKTDQSARADWDSLNVELCSRLDNIKTQYTSNAIAVSLDHLQGLADESYQSTHPLQSQL